MYGHPSSRLGDIISLADNRRTRIKAAIKRASAKARRDMGRLDRELAGELEQSYRSAVDDIRAYLADRATDDNTLRLEVMHDLLAQSEARLAQLEAARNGLLDRGLLQASDYGVAPFAEDAASIGANLSKVADDAVRFTVAMVAQDGLQLSDRLWAIDQGAREAVASAIQRNIIQGHSASQAAIDFLSRGEPIPKALAAKMRMADAGRIGRIIGSDLMTGEGNPYANALRVFRTEINRAHGEAYQAAAFEHPDVIGTQFLLSPRHPKSDICDMHARVNRYGLGPGIYPKGKNPWPAHPNTLSFTVVVFADEVSAEDRRGKEGRIDWLQRQDAAAQASILDSRAKQAALRQGVLREGEIATPWRVLKKLYQRRGIDITGSVPNAGGTQAAVSTIEGVIIETRVPQDFPIGATNKQAGDITRKLVNGSRAHDYPKDSRGEYVVRFTVDGEWRPDFKREQMFNKADLGGLDADAINSLNKMVHETNQVADTLGIPHLRGINHRVGGAAASMGDGILNVAPEVFNRYVKPAMTQAEAIKIHKGLLAAKNKDLISFNQIAKTGEYTEGSIKSMRSSYSRDISNLEERLKKLQNGVPVEAVTHPPNRWTPASTELPPELADEFFSLQADKFKQTVWHEFGHHIHQQLRVNSPTDYLDPILETDLADLFKKPNRIDPSVYSRSNAKEWFAESYSLYRLGRSDLLDPDLLTLIHRIERREYAP